MKTTKKITINPARLQWCCEAIDVDIGHLSNDINIAKTTLQKAEVSVKQLAKIAHYFNRGLLFFLEPDDVLEDKIYSPQFRTGSVSGSVSSPHRSPHRINNQTPIHDRKLRALIERVEKQRQVYLGLMEDLGEPLKPDWLPDFALSSRNIKQASANVRQWLNLPDRCEFEDLRRAVESKGIMVFVMSGYKGKWQMDKNNPVRGFSLCYDTLPIIVIKKQASQGAQAFTLMHELAHLLIHRESAIDDAENFYNYQGKEKDANEFAGNLLMPDGFLRQINVAELLDLEVGEYDDFLADFKNNWCVSGEAILVRLLNENKITQAHYNDYKALKEQQERARQREEERKKALGTAPKIPRQYRHREPLSTFGKPFVHAVFDAFYSKHITLAKASTYLDNLKITDVRKLEKYV